MLINTYGSAVFGVNATTITIEVNIMTGNGYFIVGLPDSAIRESQMRLWSALKENHFRMPGKRVIINMAPADIRKEGSAYDLTIAMGVLAASDQLMPQRLSDYIIMGELTLDGKVLPIKGALAIAIQAKKEGFKGFILPKQNAREAAIVEGLEVYGVDHLVDVVDFFETKLSLERVIVDTEEEFKINLKMQTADFSDVKGQQNIKRALTIAAAGGHNALLVGPPGAGKTMLAKRLPGILPPLELAEALETTKIHSVAGKLPSDVSMIAARPFRAPHHTISDVALVGGGANPQPGEISMAHNGVLFLDELPEFKRSVLEVLRQPIEERRITISRARFSVDYPASFMLIASMNPCPCGFYNHPDKDCVCGPGVVQKYLNKISGPLLDRFDLHVEVTPVNFDELTSKAVTETSADLRPIVTQARAIQAERFVKSRKVHCNAQMDTRQVQKCCVLEKESQVLLKQAMDRLGLSARAYNRILKVSRTIADLSKSETIGMEHIAEAITYRTLDRANWG